MKRIRRSRTSRRFSLTHARTTVRTITVLTVNVTLLVYSRRRGWCKEIQSCVRTLLIVSFVLLLHVSNHFSTTCRLAGWLAGRITKPGRPPLKFILLLIVVVVVVVVVEGVVQFFSFIY